MEFYFSLNFIILFLFKKKTYKLDEALNDVYEVEIALKENEQKKLNNNNEKTKKFILKSSMTNKGAEILIFDSRKQLEDYFQRRVDQSEDETIDLREWVIQEYIDKPLQLVNYNKRKFHLRVYVVAVGNLKVYVYDDILALFSLSSYDDCSQLNDEIDMKSHITNTCIQLDDLKSENVEKMNKLESECVKRFWELNFDEMSNEKVNKEKKDLIFRQIKDCVGEIFECLSNEPTVFQPLENAFELYGFDFLVDQNYNCFFLEANAFPDFKQTGNNLNDLIDCLFYQTISISSDVYFDIFKVCEPNKMSLVYQKNIFKKL
jgi:tubulin--tyrosine ligase